MTLTTQSPHRSRAQSHKSTPTSDANHQWGAQATHTSAQLTTNLRVPTIPSSCLIIHENNLRNSGEHFTFRYWFIIKNPTQEQENGIAAWGKVLGGAQRFHAPPGTPPSQHLDVFTSLEAPQAPWFRSVYGGFTKWAGLIKSLAAGY